MLMYALLAFVIAAAGGVVLASFVLRGRLAPWAVSLLHMLLGATGLVLLTLALLMEGARMLPALALGLLLVTALLGFFLASLHLRQTVAMKKIVLSHAGFALVGVGTLIIALLVP